MSSDEVEELQTDGSVLTSSSTRPDNESVLSQSELVAQLYPNTHQAAKEAAEKSFSQPAVLNRLTSELWDLESFDPFQLFKVDQEKCVDLTVTIQNGENITNGWLHDIVDKPDPYVKLQIKGTPNGVKKTKYVSDSKNPVWGQRFKFKIPDGTCGDPYILELKLMDSDVLIDDKIGKCSININSLNLEYGVSKSLQARFGNGSIVNLSIKKELNDHDPDLRYSLALCDDEKRFFEQRRAVVFNGIRKLLGSRVPVIGMLGSGGGFRAMIGFSGVFDALHDLGILDCATFAAALSGSTWYLSFLYSHPDFPKKPPSAFKDELRQVASKRWPLIFAKGIVGYLWELRKKHKSGQPISLTDIFGHILGDMILKDRKNITLSSQRRVIARGGAPLPLYTCLNVKNNVPANVYQEWVEFSPYEIGVPKYGAFMDTEKFGSKYYVGKIIRDYPELPLHYLQGVWGSGFCILLKRFFKSWEDLQNTICNHPAEPGETMGVDGTAFNRAQLFSDDDYDNETSSDSDGEIYDDDLDEEGDDSIRVDANGKKKKKRSNFLSFLKFSFKSLLADSKILDRRSGRAGLIFNPLRGLRPQETFPMSPLSPTKAEDAIDFKGFYEHAKCSEKRMLIVDAGLNFNIPFPALLRPQRGVDLYLSFDFTNRDNDSSPAFEELKLSEQWARLNHLPFPPVAFQAENFEKEEMREFYLFEDKNDPFCPVILHFVLCNNQFRHFKAPGVPRSTEKEAKYADFAIFDDPEEPYSTFNFHYTTEQFNRLHDLMEFNVRLALPEIKQQIKLAVDRKKKSRPFTLDLASNLISGGEPSHNCESTSEAGPPLVTSYLHFGPLKTSKK